MDPYADEGEGFEWNKKQTGTFPRKGERGGPIFKSDWAYSGMLPCFFFGCFDTLFLSMSKPRITLKRVEEGSITSST